MVESLGPPLVMTNVCVKYWKVPMTLMITIDEARKMLS